VPRLGRRRVSHTGCPADSQESGSPPLIYPFLNPEPPYIKRIDVVVFSGFVDSIDPATGHDTRPCLISVRTTRERFSEVNLARVDWRACLRNLGAQVSPRPEEMLAVKRFVEQGDMLSDLESRPNLMELNPFEFEELVSNLFGRMGFETKLTRESRDAVASGSASAVQDFHPFTSPALTGTEIPMTTGNGRPWGRIALVVVAVLIVGGVVGFWVALSVLKHKVSEALGPGSEIADIHVGWSSVDVVALRMEGSRGWPAADSFRAERIAIVPSAWGVFSGQFRVHSITIFRPYLSALRTRDGQLQVVPSLLSGAKGKSQPAPASPLAPPADTVSIGLITLRDGLLDFFDATVAQPPLKIQLEQVQATVVDVVVPSLTGKTRFDVAAVLKGVQHDGSVIIAGWVEIATKDSSVKTTLRSVDLLALEPYLIKTRERGVKNGLLDLDLQSDVRQDRLQAHGRLTISGLELAPAQGSFGTFMGLPRDAVVASLKNTHDKIAVNFILEGDIDNPQFSLNESLSERLASSMAEALGVSLGGLAKGAGSLGQKGVEAAGEAAEGAVQQIFKGKGQKKR
jgi:hypothetical protein